ncbi:MAG: hypothetical protein ACR2NP_09350, partial [Pirellulaceae bacterium]
MNFPHHGAAQDPDAPRAAQVPYEITTHGQARIDEYYWLRERENPDVISYLNQENEYTKSKMTDVEQLESELFEQTVARIKQTDQSVPYTDRGFVYYRRFEEGKQYPIYCRKPLDDPGAAEFIMLDVNQLAEGQSFCSVVGLSVSPASNLLAYSVDFIGRRKYAIRFKNLETGEMLDDVIEDVSGSVEWAEDNATVFYVNKDPQTLRSYQIMRHRLGTGAADDVLVYEEPDEEFNCR